VPIARAVSICRRLLASLSSMTSLQFVVNFALKSCKSWLEQNSNVWASLQLWFVGLSILGLLPDHEQTRDRSLASKPHLLVEQLLMNTKLAVLSEALKILRNADLNGCILVFSRGISLYIKCLQPFQLKIHLIPWRSMLC